MWSSPRLADDLTACAEGLMRGTSSTYSRDDRCR